MRLRGLLALLGLGVDVEEDWPALTGIVVQAVQHTDRRRRVDMAVIGQQGANGAQLRPFVVSAVIPRQEQAREAREGRVTQEIADRALGAQMPDATVVGAPPRPFGVVPGRLGIGGFGGGHQERQSEASASGCKEAAPAAVGRGVAHLPSSRRVV